jgi:hypothetical protein
MVNILPENEKVLLHKEYRLRLVTVCLFMLSFLLTVAFFLLIPFYVLSDNKINALNIQLGQYNIANSDGSENNLTKVITEINQNLDLLNSNQKENNFTKDILSSILSNRPAGVKFSRLFYSTSVEGKRTVEINGQATDRTVLRSFEETLRKNKYVESTKLPVSNFTKRSDIDFSINITLN